jgi:hypothetical protein
MPIQTFTASSATFTAKVRSHRIRLIGGGGVSGGATGNTSTSGGASGGQISISRAPLVPGTGYTVAVGQEITGLTTSNNVNGNDTTFTTGTVLTAKGGIGSAQVTASSTSGTGANGTTTGGIGGLIHAGGNGGTGNASGASPAAGGGGAAGFDGAGGNAAGAGSATGGTGTAPGGNGGDGATAGAGGVGVIPGGGAGGARANNNTDRAGGNGRRGEAYVDWIPPCTSMLLGVGI